MTKETIQEIRNKIKQENITYRDFKGNFETLNGVDAYSSSLFRSSSGELGGLFAGCTRCKIPNKSVLGCFNIQNYNSDVCVPVDSIS